MTVISNTSPLNYLILIDLQDILPALFGHVLIPEAKMISSSHSRIRITPRESTAEPMKKKCEQPDDELRPEYDFRSLRVVARRPGRKKPEDVTIQLAPDVAEAFPDLGAVRR